MFHRIPYTTCLALQVIALFIKVAADYKEANNKNEK
jgi:hypothetical protein